MKRAAGIIFRRLYEAGLAAPAPDYPDPILEKNKPDPILEKNKPDPILEKNKPDPILGNKKNPDPIHETRTLLLYSNRYFGFRCSVQNRIQIRPF